MVNFKKLREMVEVKGNGNVIIKEIQVSSFIRLHISSKGTVKIEQSNEEKVVIETDENLAEYFYVQNSGRTLYVSFESKFRNPIFTRCEITVFLRQIDTLNIVNYGDVISAGPIILISSLDIKIQSIGNTQLYLEVPSIKLFNQSIGDVYFKGKCESVQIKNQGQGNLYTRELIAQELTIKNMASEGNVELYATKNISINHYGTGTVYYWGNSVLKDVKQYGTGLISHKE